MAHSNLIPELIVKYKFLNFYSVAFIHHTQIAITVLPSLASLHKDYFSYFPSSAQPPNNHYICENCFTHFDSINDIDDQLSS